MAHLVELLIKHRHLNHLLIKDKHLNLFQYFLLDVLAFFMALGTALIVIVKALISWVISKQKKSDTKQKKE